MQPASFLAWHKYVLCFRCEITVHTPHPHTHKDGTCHPWHKCSSFSCRDKWERLWQGKAQQQLLYGLLCFCCVSSVSRLCTQGSSSLQSRFSSALCCIMCVMCTGLLLIWTCRGCQMRWVWLYSLCVGDDEWGWVTNATGPFFPQHCKGVFVCVWESHRLCVGVSGVCFVVFGGFIGRAWESWGKERWVTRAWEYPVCLYTNHRCVELYSRIIWGKFSKCWLLLLMFKRRPFCKNWRRGHCEA